MKALAPLSFPLLSLMLAAALLLLPAGPLFAHCDTLDGPVVQEARQALAGQNVTPVLKWVPATAEGKVKKAFDKALAARGTARQEKAETAFFAALVKIHRAAEGAPFTGLKPAGEVEPAVAAADRALAAGAADEAVNLVTKAVDEGIRSRHAKVAEAARHKDESVAQGREYVAAYVEYTHYLERLHLAATTAVGHGKEHGAGHKDHGQSAAHDQPAAKHDRHAHGH